MSAVLMCDTCGRLFSVNEENYGQYTQTVREEGQARYEASRLVDRTFHICNRHTGSSVEVKQPWASGDVAPGGMVLDATVE